MILEQIFDFISKFHHRKIASHVRNLDCKILIDVGSHKGEFLKSFLDIKIGNLEPNGKREHPVGWVREEQLTRLKVRLKYGLYSNAILRVV